MTNFETLPVNLEIPLRGRLSRVWNQLNRFADISIPHSLASLKTTPPRRGIAKIARRFSAGNHFNQRSMSCQRDILSRPLDPLDGKKIQSIAGSNGTIDGSARSLLVAFNTATIALFPDALKFPPTPVGSTSQPKKLLVSNPGTVALTIRNISVSGAFAETVHHRGY